MHQSIPADHARHDLDLIAGHAADDLGNADRTRADALLASCTSCAELRSDLVAIASATRTLRSTATAPRDFRLTEAQAATMRRRGWIARLLRAFTGPRSTTRPIAMAFTSLGLAGLLVANILPALLGGSAASVAPQAEGALPGATAAPAAASEAPARVPVAGPQASRAGGDSEFGAQNPPSAGSGGDSKSNGGATNPPDVALGGAEGSATAEPATDRLLAGGRDRLVRETNWTTIGSLGLLAIGLALFALRFIARRVR
jgi:hypothetical protein